MPKRASQRANLTRPRSQAMADRRSRRPKGSGMLSENIDELRAFIETSRDPDRKRRAIRKIQILEQEARDRTIASREEAQEKGVDWRVGLVSVPAATPQQTKRATAPQADGPTDEPNQGSAEPPVEESVTQAVTLEDGAIVFVPPMCEEWAHQFAALLASGLPAPEAVCYVLPDTPLKHASTVARNWLATKLVLDAVTHLNGSANWPDLTPEARMGIALDKHFAELAYYLYTHPFEDAFAADLKKMNDARTAIMGRLAGDIDHDSPFNKFLRAMKEGDVTLTDGATGKKGEVRGLGMVQAPSGEPEPDTLPVETPKARVSKATTAKIRLKKHLQSVKKPKAPIPFTPKSKRA